MNKRIITVVLLLIVTIGGICIYQMKTKTEAEGREMAKKWIFESKTPSTYDTLERYLSKTGYFPSYPLMDEFRKETSNEQWILYIRNAEFLKSIGAPIEETLIYKDMREWYFKNYPIQY